MIKIKELSGGVRMVTEEIPHVQSAAIGVWVRAGAVDEPASSAGISHLIEHMLFKGTEKRNARQIAADVDKIGGQINAFTGRETTCYYIKTLSANIEAAVEILSDMLLHSRFDPRELSKEKKVIFEEIKMIEDTPEDDVHDMLSDLVFKGGSYEKSIIGTRTSLRGIKRETILDYIRNEYTRDSILIAVSGNFDRERVCALLEDQLSAFLPSKPAKEHKSSPYRPLFKTKVKDVEQAHLCMGLRTVPLGDDRQYAVVLLNNILGGSMSSRLFQNIREEKGLAYSIYSSVSFLQKDGLLSIYAGTGHDKVEEAVGGIVEELSRVTRDGVEEEELAIAREQLKSSFIFGQENVAGRMFSIGKSASLLGKVYAAEEIMEKIDRVSREDIASAARMICRPEDYSGAVITNRKLSLEKMIRGRVSNGSGGVKK